MLTKYWVMIVIGAFVLFILFFVSELKESYKVLPIKESPNMAVPLYTDWRSFSPPDRKFAVLLPVPPQHAKDTVEIPRSELKRSYEMYISETLNGSIFMISIITYPREYPVVDQKSTLNDLVQEMVQTHSQNRLFSSQEGTFDKFPAVSFDINNPIYHIVGKVIAVQNTYYLLSYLAKKEQFDQVEYDYFLRNFQINPL